MINSNDKTRLSAARRVGWGVRNIGKLALRLTCLLALLLALSPSSKAYENPRLVGDNFGGFTFKDNENAIVIECSPNSTKTFTVDNWPGGYFQISAPYDYYENDGQHWFSTLKTFNSGDEVSLSSQDQNNNSMNLSSSADGKTVTFTLTTGNGKTPSSLKASWSEGSTSESTYNSATIKGYFNNVGIDSNNWNTNYSMSGSNNVFTYDFTPTKAGNAYFKINPGSNNEEYGSSSGSSTKIPTSEPSSNNAKKDGGELYATVESGNINKVHTIHVTFTSNNEAKVWLTVGNSSTGGGGNTGGNYVIYFDAAESGWGVPPNVYTWKDTNTKNADYPGVAMTLVSGTLYKYEYDPKFTYVIFSNKNNKDDKTGDLKIVNQRTYKKDGIGIPVYPNGVYNESQLNSFNEWPVYYLQSMVLNNNQVTPEYQFEKIDDDTYELIYTYRNSYTENENWTASECYIWVTGYENASSNGKEYAKTTTNLLKSKNIEGRKYKATFYPKRNGGNGELVFTDLGVQMPFISMVGANWKQRIVAKTPTKYGDKNTGSGWEEAWIQYNDKGQVARDRNGNVMYNTMWPPKNNIDFMSQFTIGSNKYDFTLETDQLVLKPGETKTGKEWKADPQFSEKYKGGSLNYSSPSVSAVKTLALDDDTKYTLYRVQNMWINGRVKIWTGWGGVTGTNSDANWSWHSNWGHFGESTNATTIQAESTVPLSNRNGDVQFNGPTYFKYVDFFYDVDNPSIKGHSVFFTELARGGAEIAATNKENDYTVGYYRPSLTAINNMSEKIKRVVIDCYNAGTEDFMGNVADFNNLTLEPTQFHTLFPDDLNLGFGDITSDETVSQPKFLEYTPSKNFANGNYRFVMTVYFSDNTKEVVESNPFTIFNSTLKSTLTAYQLVEDKENGGYVTFRMGADGKSSGNVYHITTSGNAITRELLPETPDFNDGTLYAFTDQVLLIGNDPSEADEVIGYRSSSNEEYSADNIQKANRNRYMVIKNVADLTEKEYTLQMQYKMNFDANGEAVTGNFDSTEGKTPFQLVVPTPKVNSAQVDVVYGLDGGDNNAVDQFEYKGKYITHKLTDARYQSVREALDVDAPNATEGLKGLMKNSGDVFKYYSITGDYDTEGTSTKNYFEFDSNWNKLNNFVHPSQLFSKSNGGKYDQKFVHWELAKSGVQVYDRWGEGKVTSINITPGAPILTEDENGNPLNKMEKSVVKVVNPTLYYGVGEVEGKPTPGAGQLVEDFYVYISVDANNTNTIEHDQKDLSDDMLHGSTDEKGSNDSAKTPAYNDYYYVAFYDKSKKLSDKEDDYDIALLDNTVTTADNLSDVYAEYVVKIEDIDSGNVNSEGKEGGKTIHFKYTHPEPWYEEQVRDAMANPWYKNLQIRVSYLYPFGITPEKQPAPNSDRFRMVADLKNNVVKSEANVWNLDDAADRTDSETWTGVEGIDSQIRANVKAGVGFIEVTGNGVEIFNAQGMKVAAGEGRHDVNAGVYVVRVSGQTHKVIVR